ncbi:SRPBCC family protein [Coralliovum pocilloporae]|uniref:SRPBCC family protein n=1 Tax=Coralliovum pocilloporae TaxID=3066369 RepID=UPI003306D1F0
MSVSFERAEWIGAPLEDVWAALVTLEDAPLWMPGIHQVRAVDDTPLTHGKQFEVVIGNGSHEAVRDMYVTDYDLGFSITLTSKAGGVTADYTYSVEPHKNGTLLMLEARCRAETLTWKLAKPFISMMLARHDGTHLRDFRNAFEAGQFEATLH